jgi:hypothetical protein
MQATTKIIIPPQDDPRPSPRHVLLRPPATVAEIVQLLGRWPDGVRSAVLDELFKDADTTNVEVLR